MLDVLLAYTEEFVNFHKLLLLANKIADCSCTAWPHNDHA